jgi:hypothetical protein
METPAPPRFEHGLRDGIEIGPVGPQDYVTRYWLDLANNEAASHLQRIAAVILLFQQGVKIKVVLDG